jgi:hypothetical protein
VRRLLVPLVVVLTLLGCSGSSSDDDDAGTGGSGSDPTVADVTGTSAPSEVTDETDGDDGPTDGPSADLVNAGAEPRTQLRLTFAPGTSLTFSSSTTVDQTVDGASPGPITTTYDIVTDVLSVDDGIARIRVSYADVAVDTEATASPEVAAGAEQTAAILEGANAVLAVNERAQVVDADFTAGEGAGSVAESVIDSLLSSLTSLSIVLPDEAIGVGGQWVLRSSLEVADVATTTEQTFTVVGIDDTGVDLGFMVTGTFGGGSEGTTTATGTMRFSFDSYFPETEATTTNDLTAQGSEITQDITQSVHRT